MSFVPLWDTVTLIAELISRTIVPGAYLLYYLRLDSQICCVNAFNGGRVSHTI